MTRKAFATAFMLVGATVLQARTVALWPLEYNAATKTYDGRCAIDPANDLTIANVTGAVSVVQSGLGWNYPANPDATENKLFDPMASYVLYSQNTSSYKGFYRSENGAGRYLYTTNDFTLEGWIRLYSVPATVGSLWFVARYGLGGTPGRWLFTIRNSSSSSYTGISWQINCNAQGNSGSGERILSKVEGDDLVSLTNSWHHFALTFKQSSGTPTWKLYLDGILKGSYAESTRVLTSTSDNLEMGGRIDSGSNIDGALKYVRISDEALEPDDFLNAGGSGTLAASKPVTSFWLLGKTASGGVDGSPVEGSGYLFGGFINNAANKYSLVAPSEDCAFTGNPPNPTVTLPNGNAGSFFGTSKAEYSALWVEDLGSEVTPFNDFTVEGWAKIERRDTWTSDGNDHLIGTRASSVGWLVQTTFNTSTGATTIGPLLSDGSMILNTSFGDVTDKIGEWHHYAITYDADGGTKGYGRWACYIDGVKFGKDLDNPRAFSSTATLPTALKLFRLSGSNQANRGKMDCWRVSKTILSPSQFLCASNGTAATDVLALWPMNVSNGAFMDGRDVVGSYPIEATPREEKYQPAATDDTPPQPGLSPDAGSVGFVGFGGSAPFLQCSEVNMRNTLQSTSGFTWEAWMKHTGEATTDFILYFVRTTDTGTYEATGNYLIFSHRANGFCLNAPGTNGDKAFGVSLTKDVWTHVALVYEGSTTKKWALYINGKAAGTPLVGSGKNMDQNVLYVGGRPTNAISFHGKMACMRLTRKPLTEGEFLCDQTLTDETLAYWPVESDGSTLDLDSRLPTKWRLTASGSASGSSDRAASECPNPDTSATFIGDAKANVGSAAIGESAGALNAGSIGERLDLSTAFTVEGWLKWDNAKGAVRENVVSTWNTSKLGGWRLMIDSTSGDPVFRIQAKIPTPGTEVINETFNAVVTADTWMHIALEYDPTALFGKWTLFVNGHRAGTAVNAFRTAGVDIGDYAKTLSLGGACESGVTGFSGLFDMWRVSSGLVDRKTLLNYVKLGMIILFR